MFLWYLIKVRFSSLLCNSNELVKKKDKAQNANTCLTSYLILFSYFQELLDNAIKSFRHVIFRGAFWNKTTSDINSPVFCCYWCSLFNVSLSTTHSIKVFKNILSTLIPRWFRYFSHSIEMIWKSEMFSSDARLPETDSPTRRSRCSAEISETGAGIWGICLGSNCSFPDVTLHF